MTVDLVVGDFDSADPDVVAASGAAIEQHPTAKDATDLELALDAAQRAGAQHVVVVGGGGGRLDHLFGNVLLLAAPAFEQLHLEADFGDARIAVVHGGQDVAIDGEPGELVTLLPVGGTAAGIVTSGLEYPLAGESLAPGTTRGVSNVMQSTPATVALDIGHVAGDPTRRFLVIVDVEVVPLPLGTDVNRYAHVEAAIARRAGVRPARRSQRARHDHRRPARRGVAARSRRCTSRASPSGAEQVITIVKFAEHADAGDQPTIDGLTGKFRS